MYKFRLRYKFENNPIQGIGLLIIVILSALYSCNAIYQKKLSKVDRDFAKLHQTDTNNIYRVRIFWGGCKIFPCDQVDFFVSRYQIECFSTQTHFKTTTSGVNNLWMSLENINWNDTTKIREYTRLNRSVFKMIYKANYAQNTELRCNLFSIYPDSMVNGENSFFVFFRNLFNFLHFDPENKIKAKSYLQLKANINSYPIAPLR